jgi:hypothetical protein
VHGNTYASVAMCSCACSFQFLCGHLSSGDMGGALKCKNSVPFLCIGIWTCAMCVYVCRGFKCPICRACDLPSRQQCQPSLSLKFIIPGAHIGHKTIQLVRSSELANVDIINHGCIGFPLMHVPFPWPGPWTRNSFVHPC